MCLPCVPAVERVYNLVLIFMGINPCSPHPSPPRYANNNVQFMRFEYLFKKL